MRPAPASRLLRLGRHGAALLLCGTALALGARSMDALRNSDESTPPAVTAGMLATGATAPPRGDDRPRIVTPEATPTAQPAEPTPAAPSPTPEAGPAFTYRVEPGDTLLGIATRHGIQMDTLLMNNPDLDPDAPLTVGTDLVIPTADGVLHQVAPGETVWDLASYYGTDVEAVLNFAPNGLRDGASVRAGQTLLFPGGRRPPAVVSAPATPSPEPSPTASPTAPARAAASPTASPTATTSPTATPTPSPSPTATPTPTPSPTPLSGPTVGTPGTPERDQRMMEIIRAAFSRYGLNVDFAIEVARCESRLDPSAVGAAGELGLFQLHPRGVGYGYTRETLLDPVENSRIAAAHVAKHGWSAWTCAR